MSLMEIKPEVGGSIGGLIDSEPLFIDITLGHPRYLNPSEQTSSHFDVPGYISGKIKFHEV